MSQRTNNHNHTYTDFDELFIDEMKARPDLIQQCYDILIYEGFIGEHKNYITGNKGAFVIWQLALIINGLMIPRLKKNHNKIVCDLLNKKFPGLNLWPSACLEKHKSTMETYLPIFKKNLPNRSQLL